MSAASLIGTKWIIEPNLDTKYRFIGIVINTCEDNDYLLVARSNGEPEEVHKTRLTAIDESGSITWGVRELRCKHHFEKFSDTRISHSGAMRFVLGDRIISFPLTQLTTAYIERRRDDFIPLHEMPVFITDIVIESLAGKWAINFTPDSEAEAQLFLDTILFERDIANGFIKG